MRARMAAGLAWALRALAEARIALRQPRATIAPLVPMPEATATTTAAELPAGVGPEFDAARAYALLRAQCAAGPRAAGAPERDRTRLLIVDQLGAHADEIAEQRWRQRVDRGAGAGRAYEMTNILARINGSGAGAVLLGTHWDSRPVADLDRDPGRRYRPVDGANDGASGVAVLLELARVLVAQRPPTDVILAFFDGEDLGEHFYGSRQFGRAIRRHGGRWRPDRAVVIDMVGAEPLRCATEIRSVAGAPGLWNEVHACAAELGLSGHFHGPAALVNDDHVPLARAGVPSILLVDPGYPYRHTTDDVAWRCAPAALDAIGRVLHRYVAARSLVPAG